MQKLWWVAFGLVIGLLATGLILLVSGQPRGESIKLLPPPTPPPLTVHVVGAVAQPGVYNLPPGSHVQDGVEAAGGLLPEANPQAVNLAALAQDGERIFLPTRVPLPPTPLPGSTPAATIATPSGPIPGGLININTATLEELDSLPGIGPVTAQKIIDYRQNNGMFTQIEDLMDVPDIGSATFAKIKDLVTVGS
jgi:competence protein ComEA